MVKLESTASIIVSGINLKVGLESTEGIIAPGVSFVVGIGCKGRANSTRLQASSQVALATGFNLTCSTASAIVTGCGSRVDLDLLSGNDNGSRNEVAFLAIVIASSIGSGVEPYSRASIVMSAALAPAGSHLPSSPSSSPLVSAPESNSTCLQTV
jgi:hypothetical protein